MEDTFWAPAEDESYMLLRKAATEGDEDALTRAINSGVRLDAYFGKESDDDGRTALHLAAWNGHVSIIQKLLDLGVDVDIMDRDNMGESPPIFYAVEALQVDAVKCLLAAGARTNGVFGPTDDSLLSVVFKQPKGSDEARIQTLSILLDHGIDINVSFESFGVTVLDCAIIDNNPTIIHFLHERGASFDNALKTAVQQDMMSLFPVLINAGAKDKDSAALSAASSAGKLDMVEFLRRNLQDTPSTSSEPICAAASHRTKQ